ncbi:hypothetical protein J3459_013636 [Metarhizium acridum]|nr:hypothetical protein J3459_013636 [Metarhizium acridum]
MKFVAAVLTLAAVASAAPAEVVARTGGACSVNGNNNGNVACCNSGIPILGSFLCNVLTLGQSCTVGQTAYCCNNSGSGGLINVDLLNCVSI